MKIACACGEVVGEVTGLPNSSAGRFICYCDDCQSFAHRLGKPDVLDAQGGTEIAPIFPANVKIVKGGKRLSAVRLDANGLYRWFATCCRTPFGNTRPEMPWFGLIHSFVPKESLGEYQTNLGEVRGAMFGKFAHGEPIAGTPSTMSFGRFLQVLPFIAKGLLGRKTVPSPVFDPQSKAPLGPVETVQSEERSRLRAMCRPTERSN